MKVESGELKTWGSFVMPVPTCMIRRLAVYVSRTQPICELPSPKKSVEDFLALGNTRTIGQDYFLPLIDLISALGIVGCHSSECLLFPWACSFEPLLAVWYLPGYFATPNYRTAINGSVATKPHPVLGNYGARHIRFRNECVPRLPLVAVSCLLTPYTCSLVRLIFVSRIFSCRSPCPWAKNDSRLFKSIPC